jgi:hypothetical protein
MSKGTRPRLSIVSQQEIADRHQVIFGVKPPKPRYVPPPLPPELQTQSYHDKTFGKPLPQGRT